MARDNDPPPHHDGHDDGHSNDVHSEDAHPEDAQSTGDATRLRREVEAWFVERGVPQLVEGYGSEHRIDTRAGPWLLAWIVGGTVLRWGVREDATVPVNTLTVVAAGCLLALTVAAVRVVRRHVHWWVDRRLEAVDVFALGLAVALVSGLLESSAVDGLQDGGHALIGMGAIYVAIGLGLGAISRWAARRLWRELSRIAVLLARTLPVLLILVLFLLFAAELWEVAHSLDVVELLVVVALMVALAATLVVSALRTELRALAARSSTDLTALAAGTPAAALPGRTDPVRVRLRPLQQLNLAVLALVGQLLQSAFVAVLVFAFLTVLGIIALPVELQTGWIGAPPVNLVDVGVVLREPRVLTLELLTVSGLLGSVVGLYFTGLAVTDAAYRASHFDEVLAEVRVLVAASALYRASR